jgi:hypothetical protein
MWLVVLGGFAALVMVMQIARALVGHGPYPGIDGLFGVLATIWFVASGVLMLRRTLFRCPCCKKLFYTRVFSGNAFARSCVHCGLPKWAPGPDGH